MSAEQDQTSVPDNDDTMNRLDDGLGDLSVGNAQEDNRSLLTDIEDLVEDAKTFFDAELSYQKSRAGFVGACLKNALAMGALAAILVVFALFGLVFGLILALSPLITAWGATAVVVLLILLVAYLLVRKATASWKDVMQAIKEPKDEG